MKSARIGQMHTRIRIFSQTKGVDSDGFPTEAWANVFGGNEFCWCNWTNAHGSDVWENMKLDLKETATITLWYTNLLTAECRIQHEDDPDRWEVLSIDNVDDQRKYLEVKVKKVITA